jgi:hypothetical protein
MELKGSFMGMYVDEGFEVLTLRRRINPMELSKGGWQVLLEL